MVYSSLSLIDASGADRILDALVEEADKSEVDFTREYESGTEGRRLHSKLKELCSGLFFSYSDHFRMTREMFEGYKRAFDRIIEIAGDGPLREHNVERRNEIMEDYSKREDGFIVLLTIYL